MTRKVDGFLYEDITYAIRGACFEVYDAFGGAFKESVIDKALTVALEKRGLTVESQKRVDIYFNGKKVGVYVPDKIINNLILIELKSKDFITKGDIDQFWKYLRGTDYKLGLLVNFGPEKLTIRRVIYDKARQRNISV